MYFDAVCASVGKRTGLCQNEVAKRRDLVRRIVKEAFEDPIESGKFHLTPAQAILTQESDAPEMSDEDLRALDDVFRKVKEYQEKTEDIFRKTTAFSAKDAQKTFERLDLLPYVKKRLPAAFSAASKFVPNMITRVVSHILTN